MGTRASRRPATLPPHPRTSRCRIRHLPNSLIVFFFLATVWSTSHSCGIDDCWSRFTLAQQVLEVSGHNPAYAKCVTLRTYAHCIHNMTRSCFGSLKFHSAKKVVHDHMNKMNCSAKGPIYNGTRAPTPPRHSAVCSYPGSAPHRHCGLFGDPHLRTFDNDFQTCKVQGAWPLIDNDYLTVQVTNDPVRPPSADGATATSKLTVIIKENTDCGAQKYVTYQAQNLYLPATFDDGRSHLGPDRSIQIREVEPGRQVELYIRYIDTTILVRQVGRYFTFAIRMPEDIVNSSRNPHGIQLCVKGCPRNERINYKEFIAQKHGRLKAAANGLQPSGALVMSREDAEEKCRAAQVVDFYFDSCVFDLMITGDTNFTQAANVALRDVFSLNPEAVKLHQNRTSLHIYDVLVSGSARAHTHANRTLLYTLLMLYTVMMLINR